MAKPKAGYILRSDIRRVACPTCGAAPGALCNTFDKREHADRTTAALAKDAPTTPAATEDAAVSAPAPAGPTPAPDEKFPPAASDAQTEEKAVKVLREFDAAVERTLASRATTLVNESWSLVGQRVRLAVAHGPAVFFDQTGTLAKLDYALRYAEIYQEGIATSQVQWGANDCVRIVQVVGE